MLCKFQLFYRYKLLPNSRRGAIDSTKNDQFLRLRFFYSLVICLWRIVKVIAESNWHWLLYQENDEYTLSVLCGTVGVYSIEILLSRQEVQTFQNKGIPAIEILARSVTNSPESFSSRRLTDFHSNINAKIAVSEWREQCKSGI